MSTAMFWGAIGSSKANCRIGRVEDLAARADLVRDRTARPAVSLCVGALAPGRGNRDRTKATACQGAAPCARLDTENRKEHAAHRRCRMGAARAVVPWPSLVGALQVAHAASALPFALGAHRSHKISIVKRYRVEILG